MSTIQYDFNQPSGRFDLEYVAADGSRQQPVMIHSAKFGSIERFLGLLVEHYAGAFPPWLAPVQVVGIPVAERHADYLDDVAAQLKARGIRVEVDHSDERMQKKIRNAQTQKVPFMVIVGDHDIEAGAVSFRYRSGDQDNGVPVDDAIERIVEVDREAGCRCDPTTSAEQSGVGEPDAFQRLWTPHRIVVHQGREQAGVRTRRPTARSAASRSWTTSRDCVVHRGESAYAVLNLYPYNAGHLLICPFRHVADYTDLTDDETAEVAAAHQAGDDRDATTSPSRTASTSA